MLCSIRPLAGMGAPMPTTIPPTRHFPQWSRTAILTITTGTEDNDCEVGIFIYFFIFSTFILKSRYIRNYCIRMVIINIYWKPEYQRTELLIMLLLFLKEWSRFNHTWSGIFNGAKTEVNTIVCRFNINC